MTHKSQFFPFKGFSFVEILFAIVLLGALIAPIFTLLNQSSTGTVQNRNDILAQQHATNLLAYAYSLPYDHGFLNAGPARDI
jgi:type II secretory pathway pseudopilin PulG